MNTTDCAARDSDFISHAPGYWEDAGVAAADWNSWAWQMRHRVTTSFACYPGTCDARSRRRHVYTLVPGIVVRKTDAGWEMDFGCCVMRWK